MSTSGPVRTFAVVSSKTKMEVVELPVSAPAVQVKSEVEGLACAAQVKIVISPAGIVSERLPVGFVIADQAPDPPPPQPVQDATVSAPVYDKLATEAPPFTWTSKKFPVNPEGAFMPK